MNSVWSDPKVCKTDLFLTTSSLVPACYSQQVACMLPKPPRSSQWGGGGIQIHLIFFVLKNLNTNLLNGWFLIFKFICLCRVLYTWNFGNKLLFTRVKMPKILSYPKSTSISKPSGISDDKKRISWYNNSVMTFACLQSWHEDSC